MRAVLVAGMAFGDEGKGALTDVLTRHFDADLVVRYNGGCQAAHAVVLEDGRSHIFSQFGAGMLANNKVRTHLSRFMLVEPFSMMREAEALSKLTDNVWERTTVDRKAVLTTPLHRQLNRLREGVLGNNHHGSCGRGIGATREFYLKLGEHVPLVGDMPLQVASLNEKIYFLWENMKAETYDLCAKLGVGIDSLIDASDVMDMYANFVWPARIVDNLEPAEMMVFEGAQGVMLDEKHGTAPHNTWTNTTFENADTLLDEIGCKDRLRVGCFRSYYTRHGVGPFPTEDRNLNLPEPHNGNDGFQGKFRMGRFDWELAIKALKIVGGVDMLSVSHLDYLDCLGWQEKDFLRSIEAMTETPIGIEGRGPTAAHRTIKMEVGVV